MYWSVDVIIFCYLDKKDITFCVRSSSLRRHTQLLLYTSCGFFLTCSIYSGFLLPYLKLIYCTTASHFGHICRHKYSLLQSNVAAKWSLGRGLTDPTGPGMPEHALRSWLCHVYCSQITPPSPRAEAPPCSLLQALKGQSHEIFWYTFFCINQLHLGTWFTGCKLFTIVSKLSELFKF
jgi:hypothetical protein